MNKITIDNIGQQLIKQRSGKGIRDAAKEIGISSATLSRVERGGTPDIDTFRKICVWLNVDPGEVLGIQNKKETHQDENLLSVHLKANQTLDKQTATALGEVIMVAQRMFGGG